MSDEEERDSTIRKLARLALGVPPERADGKKSISDISESPQYVYLPFEQTEKYEEVYIDYQGTRYKLVGDDDGLRVVEVDE